MIDALKLCGLKTTHDVDAAVAAGATHVGLVRFPKSPRHLRIDEAAALARHAESAVRTVVVTVDAPDGEIEQIVDEIAPDMIQLHGHESPERAREVMERWSVGVIKAIGVRTADDLAKADDYLEIADALLFDAKPPEGADLPGGNGVGFDWSILKDHDPGLRWFLAGGIHAGNLTEAVERSGARALDLSSGVEDAPGVKSAAKIAAVGDAVRGLTATG